MPRCYRCRRWLRSLFAPLLALLLVYAMVALMLTWLQRSLVFIPYRAAAIVPDELDWPAGQVHTVEVRSHDGLVLRGWHVLPDGRTAHTRQQCDAELQSGRPLVIYFPGNAGNRTFRGPEIGVWTSQDANVFLFDYRGYGDNPGSPTEEDLAQDAQSIWRYATTDVGVRCERVILYGESLGGAVATRLAAALSQSQQAPGGLVVRSSFSSLVDVAAYHYPWLPVRWALIDRFPATDHVPHVSCPILLLHGDRDTIVPLSFARRLYEAAPEASASGVPKKLLVIPDVDHNDVILVAEEAVKQALREFLESTGLGTQ